MPRTTARQREKATARRTGAGRPLALTDTVRTRILELIASGVPITQATRASGIGISTYFRWREVADEAQSLHERGAALTANQQILLEFRDAADRARAEAVSRSVLLIQKAAQGGYLLKKTTRKYRDSATGQLVTEEEETYAPVDWRASAYLLDRTAPEDFRPAHRGGDRPGDPGGDPAVIGASLPEITALAQRIAVQASRLAPVRVESPALDGGRTIPGELA